MSSNRTVPEDRPTIPPDDELPRGTEVVLVVDDDTSTLRSVSRMLGRLGYRTLEADDPADALRVVLAEPVDLLLTDIMLPKMSGLGLANTVSALHPETRVIWMSGCSVDDLTRAHGVPVTGRDFLEKPVELAALATMVRTVLDA